MIKETIHNAQEPAYFKKEYGKRNFLCINSAGVIRVSAHVISYESEEDIFDAIPGYADAVSMGNLQTGESFISEDGSTIIVRIL